MNINVDLPAHIHTRLKLKAIKDGKTIETVVTEILERRVPR